MQSRFEALMYRNTAWRFNHREGLDEESRLGLDRDEALAEIYHALQRWDEWQKFLGVQARYQQAQ